jgi:hypothetical protein
MTVDGWGLSGLIMDYAMIVTFSGSTVILFCYFWKKGALNFEEDAKFEMLNEDEK